MKRAQSPEIRPSKRFDFKPKDNLGTQARVIGDDQVQGIKTDDLVYKTGDSLYAHGQLKENFREGIYHYDYPRHVMTSSTITTKYVPKKGVHNNV